MWAEWHGHWSCMQLLIILHRPRCSYVIWASEISLSFCRFIVIPVISLRNCKSFYLFFWQRPNAETFSFINVKLFYSSSWVETLSKPAFFLSYLCHLSCNLFWGIFLTFLLVCSFVEWQSVFPFFLLMWLCLGNVASCRTDLWSDFLPQTNWLCSILLLTNVPTLAPLWDTMLNCLLILIANQPISSFFSFLFVFYLSCSYQVWACFTPPPLSVSRLLILWICLYTRLLCFWLFIRFNDGDHLCP